MSVFDKDYNPLADSAALARHIDRALSVTSPSGRAFDIAMAASTSIFKPTLFDRIPQRPCLFIGNHSLFALDAMILQPAMWAQCGRFIRTMGDRFLFGNDRRDAWMMQSGGVMGHPDVCAALMRAEQDILVFPGGAHEAAKPIRELYRLQWRNRLGFVRLAAHHGYTIMPLGIVGPDEFYGRLLEGEDFDNSLIGKLTQWLGLNSDNERTDVRPLIPAGILGSLLPKPHRVYIGFGEPLNLSQHKGEVLGDSQLIEYRDIVADQINAQIAEMLIKREQLRSQSGLLRKLLTL